MREDLRALGFAMNGYSASPGRSVSTTNGQTKTRSFPRNFWRSGNYFFLVEFLFSSSAIFSKSF